MHDTDNWLEVLTTVEDHELPAALGAYSDWLEDHDRIEEAAYVRSLKEESNMIRPPFKVGEQWFICTVTLYYVGRVVEVGLGWVCLEQASWVHWTGRLSELLRTKNFTKTRSRRPRVEPCGEVCLSTAAIVSAYPWEGGELPKEALE